MFRFIGIDLPDVYICLLLVLVKRGLKISRSFKDIQIRMQADFTFTKIEDDWFSWTVVLENTVTNESMYALR